ncbi:hypothetical protein ACFVDU_04390 [Streptomyces albidoflavus]
MTTIATPPAAALDAVLDRLSAGKPLSADEADLLRAGVTGLRRTADGLQRRSQQQAERISELESEAGELRQLADAPRLSPATCSCGGRGISHLHADVHQPITPTQQPPLRDRLDAVETTIAKVRLYADLLALGDMSDDGRWLARTILDVLDGREVTEELPPDAHPQHLRTRLAAAIRSATCPGECDGEETCHRTRFQPTVWDDDGRPVEVGISGPPERLADLITDALVNADHATKER